MRKIFFEVYDKLDAITATLIKEIDESYLQHSIELSALSAYTPKPSTTNLDTKLLHSVGSSLFTTTSSIISTTLHSTYSFFPKQPFQPRILFPYSTT